MKVLHRLVGGIYGSRLFTAYLLCGDAALGLRRQLLPTAASSAPGNGFALFGECSIDFDHGSGDSGYGYGA
jgi:hypothetical protein